MNGQVLFRKTSSKSKNGKEVYLVLGVVSLDQFDNYQDGYKYDVLEILANNGQDFSELNDSKSPEDLFSSKIWVVK